MERAFTLTQMCWGGILRSRQFVEGRGWAHMWHSGVALVCAVVFGAAFGEGQCWCLTGERGAGITQQVTLYTAGADSSYEEAGGLRVGRPPAFIFVS